MPDPTNRFQIASPPQYQFDQKRVGIGALIAALLGGVAGGTRGAAAAGAGYAGGAQQASQSAFDDAMDRFKVQRQVALDQQGHDDRAAAIARERARDLAAARSRLVDGLEGLDQPGIDALMDARRQAGMFEDAGVDPLSMQAGGHYNLHPITKALPRVDPDAAELENLQKNLTFWQGEEHAPPGAKTPEQRARAQQAQREIIARISEIQQRRGGQPLQLPVGGDEFVNTPAMTPEQQAAVADRERNFGYRKNRDLVEDRFKTGDQTLAKSRFAEEKRHNQASESQWAKSSAATQGARRQELEIQGAGLTLRQQAEKRDAAKFAAETAAKQRQAKQQAAIDSELEGHHRRLSGLDKERANAEIDLMRAASAAKTDTSPGAQKAKADAFRKLNTIDAARTTVKRRMETLTKRRGK